VAQSGEIVRREGFGPAGWTIAMQLVRFSLPLSPHEFHVNETVQADALLIVEQIRDRKDQVW